jgi:hypothetical protein
MSFKVGLVGPLQSFWGNRADRPNQALWVRCFLVALMYGAVSLAHAETRQVEAQKKPEVTRTDRPTPLEDHPKRALAPDETRVDVQLPETGIKLLKGTIRGYQTTVFALAVRQGQRLKVTFESRSNSAFFNVVDESDPSGAALFVGQTSNIRSTVIPIASDGTYLLQPYLVRSVARRGRQVDYVFKIDLH